MWLCSSRSLPGKETAFVHWSTLHTVQQNSPFSGTRSSWFYTTNMPGFHKGHKETTRKCGKVISCINDSINKTGPWNQWRTKSSHHLPKIASKSKWMHWFRYARVLPESIRDIRNVTELYMEICGRCQIPMGTAANFEAETSLTPKISFLLRVRQLNFRENARNVFFNRENCKKFQTFWGTSPVPHSCRRPCKVLKNRYFLF